MENKKSSRKWLVIILLLLLLIGMAVGGWLLLGGDSAPDDSLSNQPGASTSGESEPEVSEPAVTQPEVTEPEVTEPEVSEPEVSEPVATEPEVTEPEVSDPETNQPDDEEQETEGSVDEQTCAHVFGPWMVGREAGCETNGSISRTCYTCSYVEKEIIKASGHMYASEKTIKAATCELSGTKESTCANCGHTKTEVIAATGHKWDNGKDIVVPTSCSDVGSRRYTCTVCNKKRTEQIKGTHSFGDWVWEDAIIQSGPDKGEPTSKKYHVCKKCNYKEYGNVPEHYCRIYCNGNDKYTIKGTCTKPNVGVEVCRTCGREWRYELGYGDHNWKSETRHLTDYTEYTNELDVEISTCTACGKKTCSYTEGKGDTSLTKLGCTMQVAIEQGSAYLGGRIISNTEIAHPEWQTVYRNPVYDANGVLTQVTIRWHDKQGNRHSYVLVIADIPDMFSNYDTSGVDPNRITYVLACGSGDYLYASSVGWSG